jgi:predicted ATPase
LKRAFHRFRIGNNPGVVCYTTSAFFLWLLGLPDQALVRADEAGDLVRSLNHPFSTAYVLFHSSMLHMWRREMKPVQERARAMLKLAEEHEFQIWKSLATILSGVAEAGFGRAKEGLARINKGMDLYEGLTTPPIFWPSLLYIHAWVTAQAGRVEDGLNILNKALEYTGPNNENDLIPQIALLKGDLLLTLSQSNAPKARDYYQNAFDAGQNTGARMFELLAATRLCRLELAEGGGGRFARSLKKIYESFTEGFSTADLIDAKVLLDKLDQEGIK